MISVRVVLVEPRYEGNVGAVCRAMKNFGFSGLVLVKPCPLGDFAKAMAMHAQDLLASARTVDTFEEAIDGANVVVGTTGKPGSHMDGYLRNPYYNPMELRALLEGRSGTVALVFGPEDSGLVNEIIARCDVIAYIPTSGAYPIMNLSQAAAILLYELSGFEGGNVDMAPGRMMEIFYESFARLLDDANYPEHKKDKTMLMVRRIYGRALLNSRECYTMLGVLREIELALGRHEDHEDIEDDSNIKTL